VIAAVASLGNARTLELSPDPPVDASRSRQAMELLEGDHGVHGVGAVVAVDDPKRVVEVGEPALEQVDASAARARTENRHEDDLLQLADGDKVSRGGSGSGARRATGER
jgi:hypothetical protein